MGTNSPTETPRQTYAALEEKFIHPLLSDRVPGGARKPEENHRIMHQRFDDLVTHVDGIRAKSDFEKRRELALEFYRAWNRFLSFYFVHINREEEQAQPALSDSASAGVA